MEKRIPSLDQFINESKLNEGKNFNWKKHDFTQKPETDPNQGWS